MTEIEFLHEMVKAAGGDPTKLQDKLKSSYYECLINCLNNGGGGSGGGSNSEYTQPEWGGKWLAICTEKEVTFAPTDELGGMMAASVGLNMDNTVIENAKNVTVVYNGESYTYSVYDVWGNGGIFGMEDTGEPFMIYPVSEIAAFVIPVDQTASAAKVEIKTKIIKPIEKEYINISANMPHIDLVEVGMSTIVLGDADTINNVRVDCSREIYEQVKEAFKGGMIQLKIKLSGTIGFPSSGKGATNTYTDSELLINTQLNVCETAEAGNTAIYGNSILGDSVFSFEFMDGMVSACVRKFCNM